MGQIELNILTFPLWWYTVGAGIVWAWIKRKIRYSLNQTGLLLFARHWKEPLYGDYTRAGIVISFFLRIILIVWKTISFLFRSACFGICGIVYLLLLPTIIVMVIYQLFPN